MLHRFAPGIRVTSRYTPYLLDPSRLSLGPFVGAVIGALLVTSLVGVSGEFPLSDDWSYAHTAKHLCEHGELELLPWTGASVILQAGYGALLCKLMGFSFETLRYSTLVLAVVAVTCFGVLLGQLGIRGKTAALAMVLFGLNPLFVNLSFTFMTDLPFTALALAATCLYVSGLTRRNSMVLMTASLLCAASLLVRQHGIFVAAAAATVFAVIAYLLARSLEDQVS